MQLVKRWLGLGVSALKNRSDILLVALSALLLFSIAAHAATTGTEFQAMAEMVIGWIQGWLGIFLAIVFFIIGLVLGITKGSLMLAISGVGAAIICVMGPGIIQGMFTAII